MLPQSQEQPGTEVPGKNCAGLRRDSGEKCQEFSLGKRRSPGHNEKVFSQAQFLHETTLKINIKRHSVSFAVPLCLVKFIHPLDLRSNTASSRKFPDLAPQVRAPGFVFVSQGAPLQHFSGLRFCIYLTPSLLSTGMCIPWRQKLWLCQSSSLCLVRKEWHGSAIKMTRVHTHTVTCHSHSQKGVQPSCWTLAILV